MNDIRTETGIDVNSPTQVGAAALGASVLGNKDQTDAIDVLRGYQRARHEQQGEKYHDEGKYPLARQEYKEALKWTDTSSDSGKKKAADLHTRIAYGLRHEGFAALVASDKINDPVLKADLLGASRSKYRDAAAEAQRAGDVAPTPIEKALAYGQQAGLLSDAGDPKAACVTARKAYSLSPDAFIQTYVDDNCK